MTPAQELYEQFKVLVLELNDQGLQLHEIEEHPEIIRLAKVLGADKALRDWIRNEIRQVIRQDIDKDTGTRNRISIPQLDLPMAQPQEKKQKRLYMKHEGLTSEQIFIRIEELIKSATGLLRNSKLFTASELDSITNVMATVMASAKTRLFG